MSHSEQDISFAIEGEMPADRFHTALQRQVEPEALPDVPAGSCTVEVDSHSRLAWNEVVDRFSDASIYQTAAYGEVRWGEKNVSRLVVRIGQKIIAAAQVRVIKTPVVDTGLAYVMYGPMWHPRGFEENPIYYHAALRALKEEYAVKRNMILRIRPWGFEGKDEVMQSALLAESFQRTEGMHRVRLQTILLDLRPDEGELRKRLKKSWRRWLRIAEGEGMQILERFDTSSFGQFSQIFFEMLKEKQFVPGSDVDEYMRIQKDLPSHQRMRVSMCSKDEVPVCGAVSCGIGDTVIGLFSATAAAGRKLQAYYLLQWDEILWAKRSQKKYLDLGGVNPVTNPGVYRFKSGLMGSELTYLGVFDYCRSRIYYQCVITLELSLMAHQRFLNKVRSTVRRSRQPSSKPTTD